MNASAAGLASLAFAVGMRLILTPHAVPRIRRPHTGPAHAAFRNRLAPAECAQLSAPVLKQTHRAGFVVHQKTGHRQGCGITLQKFLKFYLVPVSSRGTISASANCPRSLWTEPRRRGPCDSWSCHQAQLPIIRWPPQMTRSIRPGTHVAYRSGECLLVVIGGDLGILRRAVSQFLFLLTAREAFDLR